MNSVLGKLVGFAILLLFPAIVHIHKKKGEKYGGRIRI